MRNPYEQPYDDTVCAGCGAPLPETADFNTWPFHGFCRADCASRAAGGFTLTGAPAIEMAERGGAQRGPGFERSIVRDWLKAATAAAPAMLVRTSAHESMVGGNPDSWHWRLLSGGGSPRFSRLTRKAV